MCIAHFDCQEVSPWLSKNAITGTAFGKFLFKNKNRSTESNNEYHGYVGRKEKQDMTTINNSIELIFAKYYLQTQNISFTKSVTELAWPYMSHNAAKKIRCNNAVDER
jgi:protein involved in sex pheromone biosynthesis